MTHVSDFLVIGSGVAGLSFALHSAEIGTVTILTKKQRADSNTNHAQGGIASVFGKDDSFHLHIRDTLKAGVGLCHPKAVELIVKQGPERVRELEKWGVIFTHQTKQKGIFDLGREGGHSKNRIVHAKDKTGMVLEHALLERVFDHPQIEVKENHMAVELITEHHLMGGGKTREDKVHCWGVYALNGETGEVDVYLSKITLLASGGTGRVYLHTTNPSIAKGDGIAMAYRAGAAVANLEFMQFHPTSLYHPDGDSFLISEAVRGFGGILRTESGEAFMKKYNPQADLAPRDIVARAIDAEMKKRGDTCVYLDVTHLNAAEVRDHFPQINERLLSLKIDMTREPIPVVPAAHYMCGGVLTDLEGRSTIKSLYVTGETACTGVHGANRLASNSLLEALVFSYQAFLDAQKKFEKGKIKLPMIPPWDDKGTFNQEEWVLISHDEREIQRLMWDYVGIVRSNERLGRAGRRINMISDEIDKFYRKTKVTAGLLELRNMACVASLITRSALFRKESRGLHHTTDYPERNDAEWLGNTIIKTDKTFLKPIDAPLSSI
ncbi:L-aspartate oxidase [bacterium]|nr:L-aspartate oxidase [bacterium]RQV94418.1 MAG: L-aspartate oxidase [bacterium]